MITALDNPNAVVLLRNKVYISNLGKRGNAKDGFIISANIDGSNAVKLFDGELNSPKDFAFITDDLMLIVDESLSNENSDNIVLANIKKNEIISTLNIDSSSLSGITFIDENKAAATDVKLNKVYIIDVDDSYNISYKEIANDIIGANAITYYDGMLYIAGSTFGGDEYGGNIYTMDIEGQQQQMLTKEPIGSGQLNGIKVVGNLIYVSDYNNGNENASVIYVFDREYNELTQKMVGALTAITNFDIQGNFIYTSSRQNNTLKKIRIVK